MKFIPKKIILSVPIASVRLSEIASVVISEIESEVNKKTFFYVNAHCLNLANKDLRYRRILQQATLVYPGGFGPVLASRILGKGLPERTPTPDFIDKVFKLAEEKKWSFYFLGAREHSLSKALQKLKTKFPKLKIVGFHHGYFDKSEEGRIISDINRKRPTVLIVGMGSPKQEKWIDDNLTKLDIKVFWAVGALFDIISGRLARAPVWMQMMGLEWLFRLFQEPKRLWKRYIVGNLEFLRTVLVEKLRGEQKGLI